MNYKRTKDKLNKIGSYFKGNGYVFDGNSLVNRSGIDYEITFFPVDYADLIDSELFEKFDPDGLPLKFMNGSYGYFYSKIFTYALAAWHCHLKGKSDRDYLEIVKKVASYISRTIHQTEDNAKFLDFDVDTQTHSGPVSGALEQGIGIFLLCVAHQIDEGGQYLSLADNCLTPYYLRIEEGGIARQLPTFGVEHWYEECVTRPIQILNGALDGILGPAYLNQIVESERAKKIVRRGIDGLEKLLPKFDRGYWSNYFISERGVCYIASMKYHSIHIFQLKALAKLTGSQSCADYANLFEKYSRSPVCRMRSGATIAAHKALGVAKR